jgi:hypothetical protein
MKYAFSRKAFATPPARTTPFFELTRALKKKKNSHVLFFDPRLFLSFLSFFDFFFKGRWSKKKHVLVHKKGRVSSKKARVSPKKGRVSPDKSMCECPKKDVSVCPIPFLSGNGFTTSSKTRSTASSSFFCSAEQSKKMVVFVLQPLFFCSALSEQGRFAEQGP